MKDLFPKTLIAAGFLNVLWLTYFICTTEHSYLIAQIPSGIIKLMLVYIPLALMLLSLGYFFIKKRFSNETPSIALAATIMALIPDAIFVIGSLGFAEVR